MRKEINLKIAGLLILPLFLGGCANKGASKEEVVNEYQAKLASEYEKKGSSYLSKGQVTEASVYYELAQKEGKKDSSLVKSLSLWRKGSDLEANGNYSEALDTFKKIKQTNNKSFNQVLANKISELTKINENIKKYTMEYQEAQKNYNSKNYQIAITKLRNLLQDPAIKSKEYLNIYGNINNLLLTATIELANSNLAAAQGSPVESQNESQQPSQPTQANASAPKLANGKQVTQEDITKAREQINILNVNGVKGEFYSGEDIKKIIDISIRNKHKQITKEDVEEFLKPNK